MPRATQPVLPPGRQQSEKHWFWAPRALGLQLGPTVELLRGLPWGSAGLDSVSQLHKCMSPLTTPLQPRPGGSRLSHRFP